MVSEGVLDVMDDTWHVCCAMTDTWHTIIGWECTEYGRRDFSGAFSSYGDASPSEGY